MNIAILTAMEREVEQIGALLQEHTVVSTANFTYLQGVLGENNIALICSGIGKVNATIATVELINRFAPDCVISMGVAGGIDSSLSVMDLVVSSSTHYHDVWCGEGNEQGQVQGLPSRFECDSRLVESVAKLVTSSRVHRGVISTGDQFITSREELDRIKASFPESLAVDMESAAIAQVCYKYDTPFTSIRIISDTPGAEGHQQQYDDFWGTLCERSFDALREITLNLPNKL